MPSIQDFINDYIKSIPLVPAVPFSTFNDSSSLNAGLDAALLRLFAEFGAYYMNNCTDDRVQTIYGTSSDPMDAQFQCQELVYDWAQVNGPYKCNNWFCNLQGTCDSKTDDTGFIVPSCSCKAGYAGQNCMFNQTTYDNADAWVKTIKQWLDNYLLTKTTNNTIIDGGVVSDFLSITEKILMFSSNANPKDLDKYGDIISAFAIAIINNKAPQNSEKDKNLFEFIEFIFSSIDSSLQGVDPTQVAGLADVPVKITDKYEMQKSDIPIDADLNLSPKDLNSKLRFLQELSINAKKILQRIDSKRLLQIKPASSTIKVKKPAPKKVLNADSAKAFLPKTLTSALTNSTVTFVLFKDPAPMIQLNSVSISSQVVSLKVSNKTTAAMVPFPTTAGSYQIYLPWAQVPFSIPDNKYVNNCKVYSFDGKTWTQTQSCTVLATTNSTASNLDCKTFGTLGVSCTGASVPSKKTTTGSSFLSVTSFIVYTVLGFILF